MISVDDSNSYWEKRKNVSKHIDIKEFIKLLEHINSWFEFEFNDTSMFLSESSCIDICYTNNEVEYKGETFTYDVSVQINPFTCAIEYYVNDFLFEVESYGSIDEICETLDGCDFSDFINTCVFNENEITDENLCRFLI